MMFFRKILLALPLALTAMSPALVYADTTTSGSQTYDSKTSAWSGDGTDGKVHLYFSTDGGSWQDSGANVSDESDNVKHDNGTYVVTIPNSITLSKMNIGPVDQTINYIVNIKGTIDAAKKVYLTATDGTLTNGASQLNAKAVQGKTTWTSQELYGSLNDDGGLIGTNSNDQIQVTGTALNLGTYTGTVAYTAQAK